jgi:hypothetical protein
MFRTLTSILLIALLSSAVWAVQPYHEVQVVDERGEPVTTISSIEIYAPDTTTNAVIYQDRGEQNTITIPMTTSSTNTTLSDGLFYWYGPDGYDFSITDGTNIATNANHRTRTSSEGTIVFPSYLTSITTSQYLDAESITMGTSSDFVLNAGATADLLTWTPATDGAIFRIGANDAATNSDFRVHVGTDMGLLIDEGVPSFAWSGGAATINHNSNFNAGLCTGTSTGAVTLGSATAGAITIDSTSTATMNSDGAFSITTSDASADITVDSTAGSVIIDGGEAVDDAITIVSSGAAGGIDITSLGDIDITTTGAAGEDITISNSGGSIAMTASEADAGAMLLQTSGAGGDLTINSVLGRVIIEGEEDAANAVLITADGSTASTLEIFNDTGTSATEGAASIQLLSDVGGIAIQSGLNGAAITLLADAGTSEVILINADQGTGVDSITIDSDDGGITINTGTGAGDAITYNGRTDSLIILEGTADAFETSLTFTDPTADGTINFPDTADEGAAGGDVAWVADAGTTTKDASNAAIPVTDAIVLGTSGAASAWSLPNGEEGQILTVQIVTDGGEATITPDTCAGCGWATAVLTDDIDGITFLYVDDTVGWIVIGTSGDGTNLVALTQ